MRRPVVAVLTVSLLLLACGDDDDATDGGGNGDEARSTTTASLPPLPDPDPLGGFVPDAIEFDDCGSGNECGTLTVPLDWSDPTGATIDLAVVRVPAEDPEHRIGILTTNPGGPGAGGVDFAFGGGPFAGTELARRFDIVGWDPRGVGQSSPVECDEGIDEDFLRLDPDPDDPAEQAALDDAASTFASRCDAASGELLPHVGTDDVARDLEAIRRSLGLPMAYVGFSYGTFVGERYAELFPTGARSIVLDGVVDPEEGLDDLLRGQTTAFERVLPEALGDELATYDEVAATVEEAPIPTDDGRVLTPADLATGTVLAGYSEQLWPIVQQAVQLASTGDGTLMLQLADEYRTLGDFDAYQAVSCLDFDHPTGAEAWAAFAAELEAISSRWGAAIANEMLPCAFWPAVDPITGPVRAEGSPPILVLGTTGDPATPVEAAERVAAGLADGHLLVWDGEGHTAYGQDPCVDDVVEAYLIDGTLPPEGARC